jgi:hypothetical protein
MSMTGAMPHSTDVHVVSHQRKKNSGASGNTLSTPCTNCGRKHEARRSACPAFGKECRSCGKLNHFAQCCKSKPQQTRINKKPAFPKQVHDVRPTHEDAEATTNYVIDSVDDAGRDELRTELMINGTSTVVKIDTGAKCNVMSLNTFLSLVQEEELDRTQITKLVAFGGSTLDTVGVVSFKCSSNYTKTHSIRFHVVDSPVRSLLGLADSLQLGLINTSAQVYEIQVDGSGIPKDILDAYPSLFDGKLGKLPVVYKIKLDPDVRPMTQSARNIPIAGQG